MATAKKKPAAPEKELGPWDKVPVRLPRITGGEEQEYISVNDYSCIIPRDGKPHMVPLCVAKELRRSERAEARKYEHRDEMISAAAASKSAAGI